MTSISILLTPKRAKFSAAHSLSCFGADHPCSRKHGHTWWVQATFSGVPKDGLLIGYEVVREVVQPFDHTDLDTDPIMGGAIPTGECILGLLVDLFEAVCANRTREADTLVTVVRVELVEDPIPGDAHTLVWVRPGWEWVRP